MKEGVLPTTQKGKPISLPQVMSGDQEARILICCCYFQLKEKERERKRERICNFALNKSNRDLTIDAFLSVLLMQLGL